MTPEGKVKDYLVARIRALGGETRFAAWIGRKDCPDCRVMFPNGEVRTGQLAAGTLKSFVTVRNCWVETKAPGDKPRPSQDREHARMRALGEIVLVIATKEDVDHEFPAP